MQVRILGPFRLEDSAQQLTIRRRPAFFGVSLMYFFEQAEADRGAVPPELVAALKDDDVRDMALRAAGLSERSLRVIRT